MKKTATKRSHKKTLCYGIFIGAILLYLGIGASLYVRKLQEVSQAAATANSHSAEAKALVEQRQKAQAVAEQKAKEAAEKKARHSDPASILVLVNKKHPLTPMNFAPADLVTVNGALLSAKAATHYSQMQAAAAAEGQPFQVTSSYRSYEGQVMTYNHRVGQSGQSVADTYSARPGFSEHQTGFVIDVAAGGCVLDCFGSTTQYQWFKQNAPNYGFIQRYWAGSEAITGYKAEEWHYRYVGVEVAQDMQQKGIKTLEEYWGFEGGDYQ